jgi:hypothetical protein
MKTQKLTKSHDHSHEDLSETNWPIVITILTVMVAFLIAFYLLF